MDHLHWQPVLKKNSEVVLVSSNDQLTSNNPNCMCIYIYIYIYNIDTHTHIFHTSVLVSMHIMPPVDQVKFSTKFTASQRARLARLHQPSGVATVLPGG